MKFLYTTYLYYFLLCSIITPWCQALDDVSSTFMYTKPASNALSMQQSAWHNIVYDKQHQGAAFQIYGYAQQNMPTTTQSRSYFLFDGKEKLTVQPSQDLSRVSPTFDIAGQWFGLSENEDFTETFSFKPEQEQFGVTFEYNHDLCHFADMAFLQNINLGIAAPVLYVKNRLTFSGSQAMRALLNRPNQTTYLLPKSPTQERINLANVMLYISTKYLNDNDMLVATKTFVNFPATHHADTKYIFSPQQGFNGHIVFGSQVTWQFPIVKKKDTSIDRFCWFFTLENKHFFKNNQIRTLDLTGKPYSRYMRLYDTYLQQEVLAANVLSPVCEVRPYNHVNFITGLRFKYKYSIAEFGYELYGHPNEELEIKYTNPWQENRYGIANVEADGSFDPTGAGVKTATEKSTIATIIPDAQNTFIRAKDIDMLSGAARSTITHRAFGSGTFAYKGNSVTTAATFGAFIEVSQNNAGLSTWGGWCKITTSF